jgi:hypothetical protein
VLQHQLLKVVFFLGIHQLLQEVLQTSQIEHSETMLNGQPNYLEEFLRTDQVCKRTDDLLCHLHKTQLHELRKDTAFESSVVRNAFVVDQSLEDLIELTPICIYTMQISNWLRVGSVFLLNIVD